MPSKRAIKRNMKRRTNEPKRRLGIPPLGAMYSVAKLRLMSDQRLVATAATLAATRKRADRQTQMAIDKIILYCRDIVQERRGKNGVTPTD